MKKILKMQKKKISILSFVLALLFSFSLNYTPISLVSRRISEMRKSSAYSPSTTQTYYGVDGVTSVTTESNVSSGHYADGTKDYFSNSSNNYNIFNNYTERYENWLKKYVDKYLEEQDTRTDGYNGAYKEYLNHIGYTSLGNYYTENKSSLSAKTFRDFFESFVTSDTTWTNNQTEYTLKALFSKEQTILNFYQSYIYNSLANYLLNEQKGIESDSYNQPDGLFADGDFYENSISYLRVKKFIDDEIVKTTVIYSYDGKSQTDYVAAIIADKAPVIQGYYYAPDDYLKNNQTSFSYATHTYTPEGRPTFYMPEVYYFGQRNDLTNGSAGSNYSKFINGGYTLKTLESGDETCSLSYFELNTLYFRLIQPGEFGYMDSTHPTYYRYSAIPYDTTNSNYEIYVVDDLVTANERATYDSLYYVHVISSSEIETDKQNISTFKDDNNFIDTKGCYYVQIPYFANSTEYGDAYFKKLFSSISENYYKNLITLFTENGQSKVYFKISSATYTNNTNLVYISDSDYEAFISRYPTYSNTVIRVTNADDFHSDADYTLVTSSFPNYYREGFELYFKQNRTYFTQTNYEYDSTYETISKPDTKYETNTVASEKYDNFDIYALVDNFAINGTSYKVVSSDVVSNPVYELISSQNISSNYSFYYKHKLTSTGDVDTLSYETTENGTKVIYVLLNNIEVSGNNFKVITSESTELIINQYVSVPETVSKTIYGENETYKLFYKHATETINQIYVVDDSSNANNNEVYKNLNYKVITTKGYEASYFRFVEVASTDANYNKNFKLFYKLAEDFENKDNYASNSSLFIQNAVTGKNAVYIIDDSLTATDKTTYKTLYYTAITTAEFNNNSDMYVLINQLDDNYSSTYTKLYYKYVEKNVSNKRIYVYSSSASSVYTSFYNTDSDYRASDYELIESDDPNFVPGLDLYYKKNRTETKTNYEQKSFYYYNTSSAVTLQANSFYAISFYAYTNGNHYDENDNLVTGNVEASLYITDSKNVISDVSIEHIQTNGKWQKYVAFIATDALNTSTITISMYMGDKNSIAGSLDESYISGTVLFNEIKITKIGETDYNKQAIDDKKVQGEVVEHDTEIEKLPIVTQLEISNSISGQYVKIENLELAEDRILDSANTYYNKHLVNDGVALDEYELDSQSRPQVYVYVDHASDGETTKDVSVQTTAHTYTDVDAYKNPVIIVDKTMIMENEVLDNRTINDSIIANWNYNFNFDTSDMLNEKLNNLAFAGNEDGYTQNDDWHYYISREHSGQGNYELLQSYQDAYLNGKASVSVINESEIDKTQKEDDKEEEKTDDDNKEDDKDKVDLETAENTFANDNKVLKITNTDRLKSLGIQSVPFTINQSEYYKVTAWIYSPNEEATATLKLESILKTSSTSNNGSLLSVSASKIQARLAEYEKTPTNEYCWIPVSFYIEGNAYQNQDVRLVLLADKNSTVYFDNIQIQKITSANYDSANSDSDTLTYCLSLSPSSSIISSGITNGYFNLLTVTDNYINPDYTLPRKAENWTIVNDNSKTAIAGVVPTSSSYIAKDENFYTKYNGGNIVSTNGFAGNVFAIYSPETITSPLDSSLEQVYKTKHNYKIYSASMSLSASSVYKISFEFMPGYNFSGNLTASLYAGSVAAANVVSSMKISSEDMASDWTTYTFYVQTGLASSTIYLEFGVENAVGTCFFQKASNVKSTHKTIEEVRDSLVSNDNSENQVGSILDYSTLKNIRLVNVSDFDFSIHSSNKNDNNVYESNNYIDSNISESSFTTGLTGTTVASYYTSTTSNYYTAEIKNVDFIKNVDNNEIVTDADNIFYIKEIVTTNSETNETETSYKLYSDSMFTVEVVGFDVNKNKVVDNSEINNFTITKSGSTVKISVNKTDTTATAVTKTDYEYKFNEDVVMNNVIIPAEELNNSYSQNVMILANSYSTDFTSVSPSYPFALDKTSYYIIKVYVKTSDMGENGLNISIDSVTVNWNNINTTKANNADENGFVCYELWVSTNTSSFSKVNMSFSLGSKSKPCAGYAIIAGVSVEKLTSETLFNEYCDAKEELVTDADNSIAKRYYGTPSSSNNNDSDKKDDENSSTIWATFFYIFSSLLLGVVLIMALVAVIIKKHPIKINKKVKDDSFEVVEPTKNNSAKKSKKENSAETNPSISTNETVNESNETKEDNTTSEEEGF